MNEHEAIQEVLATVVSLDIDGVAEKVSAALKAGADPRTVLNEGLSAGVKVVGERFQSGEYYLTAREVRYWVAMNVRYDPGKPIVLASLWVALSGIIMTFIGRMRRAGNAVPGTITLR